MSIEQELEKEGIYIVKQLDTLTTNSIAKSVAVKLVKAFPNQKLSYDDLFIRLSRINMYIAKMPAGANAKYYYKTQSIYFSEKVNFAAIDTYAIHECIHALQEYRDKSGALIRLGFCNFLSRKLPGMALNEAAVQLMSAYTKKARLDTVKYFDIALPTYSPSHYALECTLVSQMAYFTGLYDLFNSTLYSNDIFMEKFVLLTSRSCFFIVQNNMDELMALEDELAVQNQLLAEVDFGLLIHLLKPSIHPYCFVQ